MSRAYSTEKGKKRVHKFSIYLVTAENQAELVFEGKSSGKTKHFQTFSLGDKASFYIKEVRLEGEARFFLLLLASQSFVLTKRNQPVPAQSNMYEGMRGGASKKKHRAPHPLSSRQPPPHKQLFDGYLMNLIPFSRRKKRWP